VNATNFELIEDWGNLQAALTVHDLRLARKLFSINLQIILHFEA